MAILIIGGDSKLAKVLVPRLKNSNLQVYRTTRRSIIADDQILLNFDQITEFRLPKNLTVAVILGGVTDYGICESNFTYAHFINCVQIPSLVGHLLNNGVYVCYISTNTVFTSPDNLPTEYETHNPSFNYALLKSKAEHQILMQALRVKKSTSLSILRLTKNVGHSTPPFDSWVQALSSGQDITPFVDLFFAPILFSHSAEAIYNIIWRKLSGIFHLSGEADISYSDFAKGLISTAGLNPNLVKRVSSKDVGVNLTYSHPITGLDMKFSSQILGLQPVSVNDVYKYYVSRIHSKQSSRSSIVD
jgi:dTDP-4-dehydrorhamnose reductase